MHAIAGVLKRLEKSPSDAALRQEHDRLVKELKRIQRALRKAEKRDLLRLKAEFGIGEEFLRELEQKSLPAFGDEYRNEQIQRVPSTHNLDELIAYGVEALTPLVDPEWLRAQSKFKYRQSYDRPELCDCRLHLVGRQRLLPADAPTRPHRFAQMLLVSSDIIAGRHDLDFFHGPMLVSEVAALGRSLNEIHRMGPEAERKLNTLPSVPDQEVASAIYELVVGAACVRAGRQVEMLPASKVEKTPDLRIHDQAAPFVLECKRRIGLSKYAEAEARHVERLYSISEALITRHGLSVEAEFDVPVSSISEDSFLSPLTLLSGSKDTDAAHRTSWGNIRVRRLRTVSKCETTRMFSPAFLLNVFGWNHVQSEWDGLICQVDPTPSPVVSFVESSRCLKWRCNAAESRLKKARGVTSLWADAVKQIPTGEMGGIYVGYEETMRAAIGDARTEDLLTSVKDRKLSHRNWVSVPWTVVSRLYPQALGDGVPELIESAIPMAETGYEHLHGIFPSKVFVPE